jgi:hypothetical protein
MKRGAKFLEVRMNLQRQGRLLLLAVALAATWPHGVHAVDCTNLTPVAGDDRPQIQQCLDNATPLTPVTLVETGEAFDVQDQLVVPPGVHLRGWDGSGSPTYPRIRPRPNWNVNSNRLIAAHANTQISFLTLDADSKIIALNSTIITPEQNYVYVHDTFLRNNKYAAGVESAGVIIWAGRKGVVLERVQIHDNFHGVVFHSPTPAPTNAADANRIVDSVIYHNSCSGVTINGYGEIVGSLFYKNGFDCHNPCEPCEPVHIPGTAIHSLGNNDGFLLRDSEVRESCGHNLDLNGIRNATIEDSYIHSPGVIDPADDPTGACKGGASIAMLNGSTNLIRRNVIVNNTTFTDWAAEPSCFDGNGCFGLFRAQPTKKWAFAFYACAANAAPGSTLSNFILSNEMRSDCPASNCKGVGYFLSPGTGVAAPPPPCGAANRVEGNDPVGSEVGSVRCGSNVYSGNSDDSQHGAGPDPECVQHQPAVGCGVGD